MTSDGLPLDTEYADDVNFIDEQEDNLRKNLSVTRRKKLEEDPASDEEEDTLRNILPMAKRKTT